MWTWCTWRSRLTWRTQDINIVVSPTHCQGRAYVEYWEMGWSWSPMHRTPPKEVHYASGSNIWEEAVWHKIAGVLKNLAGLRQWIDFRSLVSGNSRSYIASNYVCCSKWINMNLWMRYTSRKDTLFLWYSVVLGFCSRVCGRWGNIMCRTSLSAVRVCWSHTMFAVSVREDGEFGFTKKWFNIERERILVQCRLSGNLIDSSSRQCQDCLWMGHT